MPVPEGIVLGLTDISVSRPTPIQTGVGSTNASNNYTIVPRTSNSVRVSTYGGYVFAALGAGQVAAIEAPYESDDSGSGGVLRELIEMEGPVAQTLATGDRSRVYALVPGGVAVVDALTLRQVDLDSKTLELDKIKLPGGVGGFSMTMDPKSQFLYVAAPRGRVYVVDIRPGSNQFHKVVHAIELSGACMGQAGRDCTAPGPILRGMDVSADGKRLYIAAPATTLYSGTTSWVAGGREPGNIIVVNVDPADDPSLVGKATKRTATWRQPIARFGAGRDPHTVVATNRANQIMYTAYLRDRRGLWTLEVNNDDPTDFKATGRSLDMTLGPDREFGFDLDIQNAAGLAVTADNKYAFVADWHIPFFPDWSESQPQRKTGAKIGIVKDPFTKDAKLISTTAPIPQGAADSLVLTTGGRFLYATYRGANDVLVFDVHRIIQELDEFEPSQLELYPIDLLTSGINREGIHTGGIPTGLSVQPGGFLKLINPITTIGNQDQAVEIPTFRWEIDRNIIGPQPVDCTLYVSTFPWGEGLLPNDTYEDPDDLAKLLTNTADLHPNRILTLDVGSQFETSYGTFEFKPDDWFQLTAGQTYYWAVDAVALDGRESTETAQFKADPIELDSTINGVTVITHGFEFDVVGGYIVPQWVYELADSILTASGGGTVLKYTPTGWNPNAENQAANTPLWSVVGNKTPKKGDALVLIMDWVEESDITDSGFSEAAADAMFAGLLELHERDLANLGESALDNALLDVPFHFIGHNRGAVVNSEIIRRLLAHSKTSDSIHMTTLDPHFSPQSSLNIPVQKGITWLLNTVGKVPALKKATTILQKVVNGVMTASSLVGLKLDTIEYGNFGDPKVQVWNGVDFADNYYQQLGSANGFTLTWNGEPVPNADLNMALGYSQASGKSQYSRVGFDRDDLQFSTSASAGWNSPSTRHRFERSQRTGVLLVRRHDGSGDD